ncbi:redox-sensitive bicupin YhaK (pirin superfamily) [Rhodanobacter sp. K2T2]|nr:redox-sensitive bicupin YhaK (pirin superfamily) [Rhodanobacter sp. K2T2]
MYPDSEKRGVLRLVASPTGERGSVTVHQDVRLYAGLFDGQERATLDLDAGRLAYVHVVRGSIGINGTQLAAGDAVKLTDKQRVEVAEGIDAEVLVFDLTPFPRV